MDSDIIEESGGMVRWMSEHLRTYLAFAKQHSEVCSVLKLYDDSLAKVNPTCNYRYVSVVIETARIAPSFMRNSFDEVASWHVTDPATSSRYFERPS